MTNRRFPVLTDPPLTIPWEVAEQAYAKYLEFSMQQRHRYSFQEMACKGGMAPFELDTWYGKHWREVAE